jgi:hypothetical protein
MRLAIFLLPLCALLLGATPLRPTLRLEATMTRDEQIDELAGWGEDRLIDGIGWRIASAVRGDDDGGLKGYARRGYTVMVPQRGDSIPWRRMYVLAGFDLHPDRYLLVTVRDPEHYWQGYDIEQNVQDAVELVWYDRQWNELYNTVLDFAPEDFPDDFRLTEDQKHLLAIKHPVTTSGSTELIREGHSLVWIDLRDGAIGDLHLPETDGMGTLPASWYPVKMHWNSKDELLVQAGDELRRYSLQ